MRFLHTDVEHGPVSAREIIERAKHYFEINESSLQRAREKMVVATKAGYQRAWVWSYSLLTHRPSI